MLSSTSITTLQLQKAKQLLLSFVIEFEQLYGEENMVFNVHQLLHMAECVENNGSLFLYSTYSMEDHIGHLISLANGTTDICHQICEKYILEKRLICHLEKSGGIAKQFYDDIQSKLFFPIALKIHNDIVIGKSSQVSRSDESSIRNLLCLPHDKQIDEYDSILWNGEIFYESTNKIRKKRTRDTFVMNLDNNCFGEIKSIFVVDSQTFLLIEEKYEVLQDSSISSEYIIFLNLKESFASKVMKTTSIGSKYVFVGFENILSCSKFPNLFERN